MAKRRRWVMAGPWKHPDSGIWYYRKATPSDLKKNRERLLECGVAYKAEIHRSLNTKDKREAERLYLGVSQEVEIMWERWREVLQLGPVALSYQQITALSGLIGEALLSEYEANPQTVPRPPQDWFEFLFATIKGLGVIPSVYMGDPLAAFEMELAEVPAAKLEAYISSEILKASSWRKSWLEGAGVLLSAYFDAVAHKRTVSQVKSLSFVPHKDTVLELETGARHFVQMAYSSLGDRLDRRYAEPEWVRELPRFEGVVTKRVSSSTAKLKAVTFSSIIDEHEEDSNLRAVTRPVTPATIRKYRTICEQLAEFRGKDTASDIKGDEVESWKREMLKNGDLKNNTIRDKIMAIKAVSRWGNTQAKGKLFPGEFPLKYVQLPPKENSSGEGKSYTLEQARRVLECSRLETELHLRWVPWIAAYTGMRVGEAQQLEQGDFFQDGDDWFLHIRVGGGRTTKTGRPRKVPIHKDLVGEGFIDFYRTIKQGRLFLNNSIGTRLSEWVGRKVFSKEEKRPAPSHGFRHLWEDLVFANIEHRAALYLMGRKSGTSLEFYEGGNEKLTALVREMKKFPSILTSKGAEQSE